MIHLSQGVTSEDLFEADSDDFGILRGRAFGGSHVAIFSTYEYDNATTAEMKDQAPLLLLLNTVAHEVLHCFGQDHCVWRMCVMNAWSDVVDEYDNYNERNQKKKKRQRIKSAASMHLCPLDLKKLWILNQFDLKHRYKSLLDFYRKYRFKQQVKWVEQVLEKVFMESEGKE